MDRLGRQFVSLPQPEDAEGSTIRGGGLQTLPHVAEVLGLQGNNLTTLPGGLFDGLSSIGGIALSRYQFTELPASGVFDELSTLWWLGLDDNELSELPDNAFAGLTELRTPYLPDNDLSKLTDDVFDGLSNL